MRVIAGLYRSRILKSLKGLALRPTSDRLRETLFNVLAPNIAGSRFVDLFAGTGAVGIEALSRGATEVVFIENRAPAATLIRRNLESLGPRIFSHPVAWSSPSIAATSIYPKNPARCEGSAFSARAMPP